MITNIDLYIGMMITGIFTGFGVAVGSWLANKHLIAIMEKLNKKLTMNKVIKDENIQKSCNNNTKSHTKK